MAKPNKIQVQSHLNKRSGNRRCTVVAKVGDHKWKVAFDDSGPQEELTSRMLRFPPTIPGELAPTLPFLPLDPFIDYKSESDNSTNTTSDTDSPEYISPSGDGNDDTSPDNGDVSEDVLLIPYPDSEDDESIGCINYNGTTEESEKDENNPESRLSVDDDASLTVSEFDSLQECEDLFINSEDTEEERKTDEHVARRKQADEEKEEMIAEEYSITKDYKNSTITWTMVENSKPLAVGNVRTEYASIGLRGIDFEKLLNSETPELDVFMKLRVLNYEKRRKWMNQSIDEHNEVIKKHPQSHGKKLVLKLSELEFMRFEGILISSAAYGYGGADLFAKTADGSCVQPPTVHNFLSIKRFNEIKKFWPISFVDPLTVDKSDPWWMVSGYIEAFNLHRATNIAASATKVYDESMSAWRPQTSKTGGLSHITFILCKPEDLGTEFKNAGCSETGIFLFLEIQRGREGMKETEYHKELGPTAACSI
jgi:hypothetical protein